MVINSAMTCPKKCGLNKVFNSNPLNWDGVEVTSLGQNSYGSYNIHSTMTKQQLLTNLRNSNPKKRFCMKAGGCDILDDPFFSDEESSLINKPEADVWTIQELGNGNFTVSIS